MIWNMLVVPCSLFYIGLVGRNKLQYAVDYGGLAVTNKRNPDFKAHKPTIVKGKVEDTSL